MYRYLLSILIISIFSCTQVKGQTQLPAHIDTCSFSWTPGAKHKVINGLVVGWTAHPWSDYVDTTFVKVNGLNLGVGPEGIILGIWGTLIGLVGVEQENGKRLSFFSDGGYASAEDQRPTYGTHINGFSFSLGGEQDIYSNGVSLNGLASFCYETKGIQASGLINSIDRLSGVSIAALMNMATEARGLQIGLINKCQTGNVVQIGLFNRIGKRVVPVINFRFKKDNADADTLKAPDPTRYRVLKGSSSL
mgnify:CR=1 FL=1